MSIQRQCYVCGEQNSRTNRKGQTEYVGPEYDKVIMAEFTAHVHAECISEAVEDARLRRLKEEN